MAPTFSVGLVSGLCHGHSILQIPFRHSCAVQLLRLGSLSSSKNFNGRGEQRLRALSKKSIFFQFLPHCSMFSRHFLFNKGATLGRKRESPASFSQRPFLDHFGTKIGSFGGDFGPFLGRSGVTLGSLRDHFGIVLASFWVVLMWF